MAYKNHGSYIGGDKVWYQHQDGNAWFGPASVIIQQGNSVWIHVSGDILMVPARQVKP